MTVLQVQPSNPLKAGLFIEAFASTQSGEIRQIPVILVTRTHADAPVAAESLHRLAKAFEASMNGNAVPVEHLVAPGHGLHYQLSQDGHVLTLRHRAKEGGGVSQPGIEFRIMQNTPDDLRADLSRKMGSPEVIQAMLDALKEIGTAPQQAKKPDGLTFNL
jgi:hypothetical protein